MPLFLALLLVGSLAVPRACGLLRGAEVALSALVAVRLAVIGAGWQDYRRLDSEFRQVAALIPPGALIDDLVVGGMPRTTDGPRYAMFRPLLVSEHGQIGPLFADETKQPLRLIGRLRAAVAALPAGSWGGTMPASFYDDTLAAAAGGFDYILLCHAEALSRPLPPSVRVVTRTPHFVLLRIVR